MGVMAATDQCSKDRIAVHQRHLVAGCILGPTLAEEITILQNCAGRGFAGHGDLESGCDADC